MSSVKFMALHHYLPCQQKAVHEVVFKTSRFMDALDRAMMFHENYIQNSEQFHEFLLNGHPISCDQLMRGLSKPEELHPFGVEAADMPSGEEKLKMLGQCSRHSDRRFRPRGVM